MIRTCLSCLLLGNILLQQASAEQSPFPSDHRPVTLPTPGGSIVLGQPNSALGLLSTIQELVGSDPPPAPPADLFSDTTEQVTPTPADDRIPHSSPLNSAPIGSGTLGREPSLAGPGELRAKTEPDRSDQDIVEPSKLMMRDRQADDSSPQNSLPTMERRAIPTDEQGDSNSTPIVRRDSQERPSGGIRMHIDDSSVGPALVEPSVQLQKKIDLCLAYYYQRPEDAALRSNWGVMHSMLSYGGDTHILAGGRHYNAVSWLCRNNPCRGQKLMSIDDGEMSLRVGPGFQGHEGQFLAMLAQVDVPTGYRIQIDRHTLNVRDLIQHEMKTCEEDTELTFKLIGLSHYLHPEATWRDERRHRWDFQKMIGEELRQPVVGAACGGTHRMMGFSYALLRRQQENLPNTGEWERARKYVDAYIDYTFGLQNPDGSFSTDWFEQRGANPDIERRLQTTGHILEWMIFSLPDDQLRDERIVKSVNYLADLMWEHRLQRWEVGPQGHAIRALAEYNKRVYGMTGGDDGARLTRIAREHGLLR